MRPLTQCQQQVIDCIRELTAKHGYPPTLRELMVAYGTTSTNGIKDHLRLLAKKGAVTWQPLRSRTLQVCKGF